jgi:hypothetical protein
VSKAHDFVTRVVRAFELGTLVRLTLGGYKGRDELKRIRAQPALIRGAKHLACTYSYQTRDIHKNLEPEDVGAFLLDLLQRDFCTANLCSTEGDVTYERDPSGRERLKESNASTQVAPNLAHDKKKNYLVDPGAAYLRILGLSDRNGLIRREKNDKFRQVCKFIEVVDSLLRELPAGAAVRSVVDIGSGKSYLTFALYDYLLSRYGGEIVVQGIEVRPDLVDVSMEAARQCGYTGLSFIHGTGAGAVPPEGVDMVVALHACDTATDDAIVYALRGGAGLVVVAPCCHKYVRRHLAMPKTLQPVLGHGILEGRLADSITDGLRALFLKGQGYNVKVFEFISPEHTSKNTMITAVKSASPKNRSSAVQAEIDAVKREFGLPDFYLDRMS